MTRSEAKKRANRKYDREHVTYFKLTMRNEFAAQFQAFIDSELSNKYSSKSDFIKKAMKKQMIEDGFDFQEEEPE